MSPENQEEELKKDVPAKPADPAGKEPDADEAPLTPAEKKDRKYMAAGLFLTLFVVAGGGYYAMTGLRQTAHQLGGGKDYDQLSANSPVYDGRAGAPGAQASFPLDEDEARAEAVRPGAQKPGSALLGGEELKAAAEKDAARLAAAGGSGGVSGPSVFGGEEEGQAPGAGPAAQQGAMSARLQAKAGPAAFRGGAAAKGAGAAPGAPVLFQPGARAGIGAAAEQRETAEAKPRQAGKGSVMDSLKGTFKASLYGSRIASHDSAKNWIARAFDGAPEATTAIEYDEKMRASLDRVNPNSIPNFLRQQEVTAAEAKRLADSEIMAPKMDREGTREALANNKDYQARKMASDFASGMLNGLFAGVSGTGSEGQEQQQGEAPMGMESFADAEDNQWLVDQELQDWISSYGFGESCGCTVEAPCCCLDNMGGAGLTSDVP